MSLGRHLPLSAITLLPLTAFLIAFPDGPDPRLTGGYGEETCLRCHKGQDLNAGRLLGGDFRIKDVPKTYQPGRIYPLRVLIAQPRQSRWGFELSARFAASEKQAGVLASSDGNTQIESEGDVQYIMHTEDGTRAGQSHGPVEFRFNWTAPADAGGLILFNASGNAADGSGDESGDFIYTAGAFSTAPGSADPSLPAEVLLAAASEKRRARITETPVLVNIPTPLSRRKGDYEIQIQHRFLDSIDSGAGNAFGIDSGANINLGLNYSPADRLSVGVTRARFDDVVTFTGTFTLHNQEESAWMMDLQGGVEALDNFQREYSPFLQLAAAYDIDRLRLYATPTLIFNSRNEALIFDGIEYVNPQNNHTLSLGLGADLAVTPGISVLGEVIPRIAGFGGFFQDNTAYSAGVKLRTWGHVFSIFVARSRDFTPAKYGVNSNREADDVSLGFNIYRRIR